MVDRGLPEAQRQQLADAAAMLVAAGLGDTTPTALLKSLQDSGSPRAGPPAAPTRAPGVAGLSQMARQTLKEKARQTEMRIRRAVSELEVEVHNPAFKAAFKAARAAGPWELFGRLEVLERLGKERCAALKKLSRQFIAQDWLSRGHALDTSCTDALTHDPTTRSQLLMALHKEAAQMAEPVPSKSSFKKRRRARRARAVCQRAEPDTAELLTVKRTFLEVCLLGDDRPRCLSASSISTF
mmetsp:Transcript_78640/g.230764  ORF Transcript_78640/g.230764 Transcript_78640/m.230764 type:complete len:240 (+) Transcript_78640:64-783(+)